MSDKFVLALGGEDLEMATVRALTEMVGVRCIQPRTGWGDHRFTPADLGLEVEPENLHARTGIGGGGMGCPQYWHQPARCVGVDRVVFVECQPAEGWPEGTPTLVVDHHGDRAGEPASVLQILRILAEARGLRISPATRRWVELVAAHDARYVRGLEALGASMEETRRVLDAARHSGGITPEQEAEAERALAVPEERAGATRVIRMAHSKCATVTDRLYGSWLGGQENLLVLSSDGEVNYFGSAGIRTALMERFPEAPAPWNPTTTAKSWIGGDPQGGGYWGGYPDHEEVLDFLSAR